MTDMQDFVVSARKYRPDTFDTVVGQEAITTTLKNSIRNGHLAQAFLFCGPRGVGKTTCARILARTINCMNLGPDLEPCGECESCRGFLRNASQNIYELDAASNRSVEAMRTLVEQVRIPPQVGKYKVYIIDEVHMLTSEAFNAFLKTLEEPPAYAKFILATTEKNKIIPTILSRCQIFDFKRIRVEDIVNHLKKICGKEGISYEEEALRVIAQKADGGLRDALSMFDQMVSFSGNTLSYQQVISMLNILDYETYFEMFEYFFKADIPSALDLFNRVLENGFDAQLFVGGLSKHLRTMLMMRNEKTFSLAECSPALQARYRQQAAYCSMPAIIQALELCTQCDLQYKNSNHKNLFVEVLLLQLSRTLAVEQRGGGEASSVRLGEYGERGDILESVPAAASMPVAKAGSEVAENLSLRQESELQSPSAKPLSVTSRKTSSSNLTPSVSTTPTISTVSREDSGQDRRLDPQNSGKVQSATFPGSSVEKVANSSTSLPTGRVSMSSLGALQKKIQMSRQENPVLEVQQRTDSPVTPGGLKVSWEKMLQMPDLANHPSIFNVLRNAEPHLEGESTIALKVPSLFVADELKEKSRSLLDFLRHELDNYSIDFDIKIDENMAPSVRPYTPSEKFEEMVRYNPELKNFKEFLDLRLEM